LRRTARLLVSGGNHHRRDGRRRKPGPEAPIPAEQFIARLFYAQLCHTGSALSTTIRCAKFLLKRARRTENRAGVAGAGALQSE
jgi:hypothetical protein